MIVQGVQSVIQTMELLKKRYTGGKSQVSVVTGYQGVNYALAVHEAIPGAPNPPKSPAQRRAMFASIREREKKGHKSWGVGGPKYLERPARMLHNSGELKRIVFSMLKTGFSLKQALLEAGLRIQRESQNAIPVDLGNLKASAFTEAE